MKSDKPSSLHKMAAGFIRNNRAAALSTITPTGKPHASVVYCIVYDDLTIYFTTRAEGRKFESLGVNPEVSMLFTAPGSLQQLQLSGKAKRVRRKEQQINLLHELMKLRYADDNLPQPQVDLLQPGAHKEYAIFVVKPYEMTYANFETASTGTYKPDFQKII